MNNLERNGKYAIPGYRPGDNKGSYFMEKAANTTTFGQIRKASTVEQLTKLYWTASPKKRRMILDKYQQLTSKGGKENV